jgi:hypothetical protein
MRQSPSDPSAVMTSALRRPDNSEIASVHVVEERGKVVVGGVVYEG